MKSEECISSSHTGSDTTPMFMTEAVRNKNEKGQSLVELAFLLPVLILILAGILDVGRSMQAYVVVLNASREAALHGADSDVGVDVLTQHALAEITRGGLNPDLASIMIDYEMQGFPPENFIHVEVTYRFPLLMAVLSFDEIDLQSNTEMIVFW